MRCFYSEKIGHPGEFANFANREQQHLFKTLRGRTGDQLQIIDGAGMLALAEVLEEQKIRILSVEQVPEPPLKIHLLVALPRRQQMDQLLKQSTEVGIWSITPLLTERGVAKPEKPAVFTRWREELIAGCKQSRNPYLPELQPIAQFAAAIFAVQENGWQGFYGDPEGADLPAACQGSDLAWIVGPEGGFSDAEKELLIKRNYQGIRIGQTVMRVETAAIVGAALLQCKYN